LSLSILSLYAYSSHVKRNGNSVIVGWVGKCGGKRCKPGFTHSTSVFTVEVMVAFCFLSGSQRWWATRWRENCIAVPYQWLAVYAGEPSVEVSADISSRSHHLVPRLWCVHGWCPGRQ
jgi:hypothetical protein